MRELPIGKFGDGSEPSRSGVVCAAEVGCSCITELGPTVVVINNQSEQDELGLFQSAIRFFRKSLIERVFRRGICGIEGASFASAYD